MNSTNETLSFDRFLIMYDLCDFTCINFIFVFRCTHVRMSCVLNSYLLTYLQLLATRRGRSWYAEVAEVGWSYTMDTLHVYQNVIPKFPNLFQNFSHLFT